MSEAELPPRAPHHLLLFRKSLPLRMRLHELVRALGPTEGLVCMDVGTRDGAISYYLRKNGGSWATWTPLAGDADAVREVVPEQVFESEGKTPFEKKQFDAILITDSLDRIADDSALIEQCHKLLKPAGRLIVNAPRIRGWSLVRALGRLFGMTAERLGRVREGYTETALFNVLKDGFDVLTMRSYSRFFVEFTDLLVEWRRRQSAARGGDTDGRLRLLYGRAAPFYWLAFQLDLLLFFNRGHRMIAIAKRRAWHPRKTPVLVDGRSITEAVLSRAAK